MVDFLSDFVSASLQVLIEKIVNLGILVYQSLSDVDNKLKKLQRTLFRVQALLHDSEEKQRNDKAWQVALQDLEQLAYDADDLLDEIAIQVSNLDGDNNKDQIYKLLLSLFKTTSAPNLNTIQGRLDGILKEIDSLCLREIVQGRQLNASNRQSSSLSDGSSMFGREKDMAKIMNNVLLSEGNDLCIIPITGMVAVGKTTLAQAVYNKSYEDMRSPFQLKMWVTVTKLFDVTQLTRSIIEAASGVTVTLSDLDPLQVQLSHMLQEKKFLLVLDDVWNEVQHEWDLLLKPLRHGSKGSKIIVTTRTQLVCSLVGTVEACTLEPLLDEHCWLLLREKALGNTVLVPGSVPKLEAIGRNIARKCTGLPLAAKCVGSLMHSKVNEDEWNAILETKLWDLPKVQNEVVPALKLSYQDLAAHLKKCFAYCSMFPQSHDLDKEKIVQMWMAEGLIQAQGRRRVDDIGSDYFEELFQMFFIQKNKDNAKYSMHDAVRNLAESVSGDKFFIREEESDDFQTSHVNSNTRHFALLWGAIETDMLESFSNCKGLRSFLVSGKTRTSVNNHCFLDLFHKLKRLRVLDLSHSQITDLAVSIGSLKHLRFLDLSKTRVALLPSTTSKLCSLQTLRLKNCSNLLLLPKRMKKLNSLQHLLIGGNIKLTSMPSGIGELKRLQTLDEFIVGESGQIRELEGLNMLRGTLCIKQLQKVTDPQHAMDASLSNKRYLNKLELQWRSSSSSSANLQTQQETVLKNLEPHKNLNELTLRGYGGGTFPRWVSSPLYLKLTSISLHECQNCDSLPCLGQHPKLKSLKIVGMQNMKQWDCKLFRTNNRDAVAFQSLEILELRDMPVLQDWSGVLNNDMACLRQLTISECPELIMMPSIHNFGSIETLEFCNCDRLDSFANESLSSSVVSLSIMYCPILKARYINDGGVDWIKIKHIPFIRIDDQKFGNQ